MNRALTTAILAAVFYGGLLCWSVAWRRASLEPELAKLAEEIRGEPVAAQPAGAISPAVLVPVPETPAAPVPDPPQPVVLETARFAAEQAPEGGWEIDGRLAEAPFADSLRAALTDDGAELAGAITVDPQTEPAPWAEMLAKWLPLHRDSVLANAGVAVMEGELLLVGDVDSDEAREELVRAAGELFANSKLRVIDEFQVVAPKEEPELAIAPSEDGGLRIAGRLRDEGLKDRLVELIRETGADMPIDEQVAVGDHIGPAIWGPALVQVLPALITEVKGLQMMASGGVFLMAGSVSADTTKTALAEMAGQAFADMPISIDNQISVSAPPAVPSISISRGDDGMLRLSGLLPDAVIAERFVAAATSQSGQQDPAPVDEIEIGQNVAAAPWVDTVVELLPPFAAAVRWGALSVHGNQVALEAKFGDPESADVLSALVDNAFPDPDYKRVVEVSVAAPEGPSDEDIAALDETAKATVIYFDSASSDLRTGAMGKLETLAANLVAVPGSGIALLGHADPYGNANFNRKLSRKRCESVRAALEELGIEQLLIEIEERGEVSANAGDREYESGRRVEFEVR